MNVVAFVGPSLSVDRRGQIAGVQVVPPIRRGDLDEFGHFECFLIIDGEFGQSLSVSPKEILKLLDGGKRVIGASSMGALRASELDSYGMQGVGWVYQHFARSRMRYDDDVALTYSPLDHSPLTIPTVNVAYWMALLCAAGHVGRRESQRIIKTARSIFFADRSEACLLEALTQAIGSERLQQLLALVGGEIPDVKRTDAERAIAFALGGTNPGDAALVSARGGGNGGR